MIIPFVFQYLSLIVVFQPSYSAHKVFLTKFEIYLQLGSDAFRQYYLCSAFYLVAS